MNYITLPFKVPDKIHWDHKQVIKFLKEDISNKLLDNEGNVKYDGLKIKMITSDNVQIDKTHIDRLVSIVFI